MTETTGLVGRYMKNNATQNIVLIKRRRIDRYGDCVGYDTSKRRVWVHVVRIFGAHPDAPNRLNGYTLLPVDFVPGV